MSMIMVFAITMFCMLHKIILNIVIFIPVPQKLNVPRTLSLVVCTRGSGALAQTLMTEIFDVDI